MAALAVILSLDDVCSERSSRQAGRSVSVGRVGRMPLPHLANLRTLPQWPPEEKLQVRGINAPGKTSRANVDVRMSTPQVRAVSSCSSNIPTLANNVNRRLYQSIKTYNSQRIARRVQTAGHLSTKKYLRAGDLGKELITPFLPTALRKPISKTQTPNKSQNNAKQQNDFKTKLEQTSGIRQPDENSADLSRTQTPDKRDPVPSAQTADHSLSSAQSPDRRVPVSSAQALYISLSSAQIPGDVLFRDKSPVDSIVKAHSTEVIAPGIKEEVLPAVHMQGESLSTVHEENKHLSKADTAGDGVILQSHVDGLSKAQPSDHHTFQSHLQGGSDSRAKLSSESLCGVQKQGDYISETQTSLFNTQIQGNDSTCGLDMPDNSGITDTLGNIISREQTGENHLSRTQTPGDLSFRAHTPGKSVSRGHQSISRLPTPGNSQVKTQTPSVKFALIQTPNKLEKDIPPHTELLREQKITNCYESKHKDVVQTVSISQALTRAPSRLAGTRNVGSEIESPEQRHVVQKTNHIRQRSRERKLQAANDASPDMTSSYGLKGPVSLLSRIPTPSAAKPGRLLISSVARTGGISTPSAGRSSGGSSWIHTPSLRGGKSTQPASQVRPFSVAGTSTDILRGVITPSRIPTPDVPSLRRLKPAAERHLPPREHTPVLHDLSFNTVPQSPISRCIDEISPMRHDDQMLRRRHPSRQSSRTGSVTPLQAAARYSEPVKQPDPLLDVDTPNLVRSGFNFFLLLEGKQWKLLTFQVSNYRCAPLYCIIA